MFTQNAAGYIIIHKYTVDGLTLEVRRADGFFWWGRWSP